MGKTTSADMLLFDLRGTCLRTMSEQCGVHFEGLPHANRRLKLGTSIARKPRQLDIVVAWLRHVTGPKCAALLADLEAEFSGLGAASEANGAAVETQRTQRM
jgi:hypothetical protein